MSKKRSKKNLTKSTSNNNKTSINPTQFGIQTPKGSSVIQTGSLEYWYGPMPSPEILKKYNEIYPGIVKLICDKYDEQSKHRISLENKVVDSNIRNESRGQWMAFIIFMVGILGGLSLLYTGKNIEGYWTFFSSFALIVIQTLFRKKQTRKELEQKREPKLSQKE